MAKIAIFTGPEGHFSIAQAIETILTPEHTVSVFFDRNTLFNLYTPIYQILPSAHKIPFTISKFKKSHSILEKLFRANYDTKINDFLEENKPDLVFSTFFMFNASLADATRKKGIPFINAVVDPRTIHPLFVAKDATINMTFDAETTMYCGDELNEEATYQTTGWFVKPDFEKPYNQQKVRQELGLDSDTFTLLISSGSEGTTMVMKLLPFLIQLNKPIQVVVACGNNKTLLKSVAGFTKMLSKIKLNTTIVPISFVTNMHQYMQAADLVVGKAGPNSLFESVATKTPFFAITHISGQEDGNLDIIEQYNLGYVEENPFKAQTLLQSILDNPQQLDAFKDSLKKMADYNKKSKQKLTALVTSLLK